MSRHKQCQLLQERLSIAASRPASVAQRRFPAHGKSSSIIRGSADSIVSPACGGTSSLVPCRHPWSAVAVGGGGPGSPEMQIRIERRVGRLTGPSGPQAPRKGAHRMPSTRTRNSVILCVPRPAVSYPPAGQRIEGGAILSSTVHPLKAIWTTSFGLTQYTPRCGSLCSLNGQSCFSNCASLLPRRSNVSVLNSVPTLPAYISFSFGFGHRGSGPVLCGLSSSMMTPQLPRNE
jgi:hypothetical protein